MVKKDRKKSGIVQSGSLGWLIPLPALVDKLGWSGCYHSDRLIRFGFFHKNVLRNACRQLAAEDLTRPSYFVKNSLTLLQTRRMRIIFLPFLVNPPILTSHRLAGQALTWLRKTLFRAILPAF